MSPSFHSHRKPVTVRELSGEKVEEGTTDHGYVYVNGRCPWCDKTVCRYMKEREP